VRENKERDRQRKIRKRWRAIESTERYRENRERWSGGEITSDRRRTPHEFDDEHYTIGDELPTTAEEFDLKILKINIKPKTSNYETLKLNFTFLFLFVIAVVVAANRERERKEREIENDRRGGRDRERGREESLYILNRFF